MANRNSHLLCPRTEVRIWSARLLQIVDSTLQPITVNAFRRIPSANPGAPVGARRYSRDQSVKRPLRAARGRRDHLLASACAPGNQSPASPTRKFRVGVGGVRAWASSWPIPRVPAPKWLALRPAFPDDLSRGVRASNCLAVARGARLRGWEGRCSSPR